MKKRNLLHSGALALLLAACSTTPQSGKQEGQIDIVPAFENQTELKVSHLGKNIRYVPLETNDSSLIGNSWSIRLLEDKILVSTKEGNYVPFIHPQTGDIYFNRTPEKMIRFNQDGKYSNEEERMHIHVVKAENEAKFWLEPSIELAENYGFGNKDLKK